jgi:glucose 1-dehydrogenase/3-oxoacyl-[acyl-carrier protein] reductase
MKLAGKVALITGGGQGIGRGIAEVFADEGADIALNDIDFTTTAVNDTVEWIRSRGRKAKAFQADVSSRTEIEAMFEQAWNEFGHIDILVNNAGIETIVPFLDLTDEQWTRVTDVDLRGPWLCSQVFCKRVVAENRKGNIVNIGSIQAAKILPGRTHYAPAKLGIEAMTRNISAEMTPLGIRVNCIHPGFIATNMTAWILDSPQILPEVLKQISAARPGQPQEIGTAAAFFASDEASYITGQSIHVDGGWTFK